MADSISSFSGLASGVQWRDLIDQIIAGEAAPITRINNKIKLAQARSTALAAFKAKVQAFNDAAKALADGTGLKKTGTTVTLQGGTTSVLTATADSTAAPGTHEIVVQSLARAEQLGSALFASRSTALNISGDIRVNGRTITLTAADTLDDVARRFNAANTGTGATHVAASVASSTDGLYRLTLVSQKTGAAGIDLVDGSSDAARGLGLLSSGTQTKHVTSNGALSDSFADKTTALATLLGLTQVPAAATVSLNGHATVIDLSHSLETIAADITTALQANGITASVIGAAGAQQLQISGATSFVDSDHVLELLGVLSGRRDAVAQTVASQQLLVGGLPALGTNTLADLGAQPGETLTITGTRGDGSVVTLAPYSASGSIDALLTAITQAFSTPGARAATATIANGKILLTDSVAGDSQLSLSIVANNEQGGSVDFGAITTSQYGRALAIVQGADAAILLDGTRLTRANNTITDVIEGVTLNLNQASSTTSALLNVAYDDAAAATAVKKLVDTYNAAADYVDQQSKVAADGTAGPLHGDPNARSIQASLREALGKTVTAFAAGGPTRLADVGVEIDRYGRYTFDSSKLTTALQSDRTAVLHLFGLDGITSNSAVQYIGATDDTRVGTYAVSIDGVATDVSGSIGGNAATGLGQFLTGNAGSDVAGLKIQYSGTATGAMGTVQFTRGIGSLAFLASNPALGTDAGSIEGVTDQIDDSITGMQARVDTLQERLDRRRDSLIKQFTAMEQALSKAQSQGQWLTSQIAALDANRKQ